MAGEQKLRVNLIPIPEGCKGVFDYTDPVNRVKAWAEKYQLDENNASDNLLDVLLASELTQQDKISLVRIKEEGARMLQRGWDVLNNKNKEDFDYKETPPKEVFIGKIKKEKNKIHFMSFVLFCLLLSFVFVICM